MTIIKRNSTITCPDCKANEELEMPSNACLYFYKCKSCNSIIKPLSGDCCVFCSYGNIICPPKQKKENCC
jgi:hypothetical protein